MHLRTYRSLTNLTQRQLANRLEVTELSVIKYEAGQSIPSKEVMRRIYSETGGAVTPNDFYDLETVVFRAEKGSKMSTSNKTLLAVGLMSGTSMDGIDGALLATDGESSIQELSDFSLAYDDQFKALMKGAEYALRESDGDMAAAESRYEEFLRRYLQEARGWDSQQISTEVEQLSRYLYGSARPIILKDIIERSTHLHAEVVAGILKKAGQRARDIDLIGYHGQTVFHRPAAGLTLQVGDGQLLADLSGIPVAFDFRTADVAAGGQGAPFAPLYHAALARQKGLTPVVVANCGGIANITVITDRDEDLFAFDTGPGNSLIDRFVYARVGRSCDLDGAFGSAGQVDAATLAELHEHAVRLKSGENFLMKPPPKSLDVNDLFFVPSLDALSLQDGCATLEHFTAQCIVDSLRYVTDRGSKVPNLWIVAGGGWQNPVILATLSKLLTEAFGADIRVQHAQAVGWNGRALEAQIFAYLAVRSARQLPLSVPGTTGVPTPITGGKIVLPEGDLRRASGRVRELLSPSSQGV